TRLDVAQLHYLRLASHNWLRLDVMPDVSFKGEKFLRGEYRGEVPIPAVERQAGRLGDLIGTFWASVYVMSPRMALSLRRSNLTGWLSYAIAVKGGSWGGDGLCLLAMTGRYWPVYGLGAAFRGGLDPLGQYLDPADWDGSHMFIPSNRRSILVTSGAAAEIQSARLANLELEPAGLEPIMI